MISPEDRHQIWCHQCADLLLMEVITMDELRESHRQGVVIRGSAGAQCWYHYGEYNHVKNLGVKDDPVMKKRMREILVEQNYPLLKEVQRSDG